LFPIKLTSTNILVMQTVSGSRVNGHENIP
jgi:hypothetical protein